MYTHFCDPLGFYVVLCVGPNKVVCVFGGGGAQGGWVV